MYGFSHPQQDPKELLELKLLNFYYGVFQQEMSTRDHFTYLTYLTKLKNCYHNRISKNESSVINFDCAQMRCAYIFHFASCFSSIVAHYFTRLLYSLPWLTEKLLLADEINICCLGGGPATEFIAIALVLEDMLWKYCPRGDRPLKLNVTVIDINSGWQETIKKINENLLHLADIRLISSRLSFIQADLTEAENDEVRNILNTSDIVTMSKFMTTIHGTHGKADVTQTLQAIFEHISPDGILFFLDSSGFENYDILREVTNSFPDIFQVYGLWEHENYGMSPIFLQECYRFYSRIYYPFKNCCFKSRNYVSVWHRRKITSGLETFFKTAEENNGKRKDEISQRSASF